MRKVTHQIGLMLMLVLASIFFVSAAPAEPTAPHVVDIDPDQIFMPTGNGVVDVTVPFEDVVESIPVTLSILDATNTIMTVSGATSEDFIMYFSLAESRLMQLPAGEFVLYVSSIGNMNNKAIAPTRVGILQIAERAVPEISGDNHLSVPVNALKPRELLVELKNIAPARATYLTVKVGDNVVTMPEEREGSLYISCPMTFTKPGVYPVTVSAEASLFSEAIAETKIGTVTVYTMSTVFDGLIRGTAAGGSETLIVDVTPTMQIGVQSKSAEIEAFDDVVRVQNKHGVVVIVNCLDADAVLAAKLSVVRNNPFVKSRAVQGLAVKRELTVTGTVDKALGVVTFKFPAQSMATLAPGRYELSVYVKKSGIISAMDPVGLATFEVLAGTADPVEWTMPKTLQVSVGRVYRLITPIPAEEVVLPSLSGVVSSDSSIASVQASGYLTAKRAGVVTITIPAQGEVGELKCVVTVGANAYVRSLPLMMKKSLGLFVSTKRLYYDKDMIKAELFLYNRTGTGVVGMSGLVMEMYEDETLLFSVPVETMTFKTALKNKQYKVLKVALNARLLPLVGEKGYDLGSKRYQLILRTADVIGTQVIPVVPGIYGATQAKAIDAVLSGTETIIVN